MKKTYNWYNLEPKFKNWLIAGNLKLTKKPLSSITVKNYLSDLRHFLGWLIFKLKIKNQKLKIDEDFTSLLPSINADLINEYKSYLVENKIPLKTTNRRLSTLRKFFTFCLDQGWLKENPAKEIANVSLVNNPKKTMNNEEIIQYFEKDLIKENLDENTIKSYLDAAREFLEFAAIN